MRRHDGPAVQVSGLLADRAAGFAVYLASRGYASSSTKHHLYLMADLSAWLAGQGLAAGDLTGPVAGRFWEDLRARGSYLVKGTSLEPLLAYLRSTGVLPQQRAGGPASVLLQEYDRYLRTERRAGEVTITQYLRYANEFLAAAGEPPDGAEIDARLAALDGAQVLDVVSRQVAGHRLPSIGAVLTGDRAFLRFLERTGRTARPLAAAVPRAARQPSRLPEQVDPATAAAVLASCDRAAEGGCRDRAVLLLLHRYGLRPVEGRVAPAHCCGRGPLRTTACGFHRTGLKQALPARPGRSSSVPIGTALGRFTAEAASNVSSGSDASRRRPWGSPDHVSTLSGPGMCPYPASCPGRPTEGQP